MFPISVKFVVLHAGQICTLPVKIWTACNPYRLYTRSGGSDLFPHNVDVCAVLHGLVERESCGIRLTLRLPGQTPETIPATYRDGINFPSGAPVFQEGRFFLFPDLLSPTQDCTQVFCE